MILGVAIRINQLAICLPKSNRHSHVFMYMNDVLMLDTSKLKIRAEDQGFYTDTGAFLTRKEAYKHALDSNQLLKPKSDEVLYSEDLW